MDTRKITAAGLGLVLLGAVAGGVWYSNQDVKATATQSAQIAAEQANQITLHGLIGSEKENFFNDPRVKDELKAQGLTVIVEKVGSRAIVGKYDPKTYDFGFPSGAPSALELKQKAHAANVYTPFYTPMVLASWRPIAEILVANGIAKREGDIYYVVDLPKLISLISAGTRWRDLKDSAAFSTGKAVLIGSTDVRTSNSAAMYLALASYEANKEQIVQSQQDVDQVMATVAPLFLRQGFQEQSSAGPFEDYLALGMGKAPLLMAYESQLVEVWLKQPDKLKGDMVLLYPKPTVYSKHILVPFTPAGERLGAALERDPKLQQLAHEYGFRTAGNSKGPDEWDKRGIKVPAVLVDVIDPPSYEWLERMIHAIETRFN